MTKIAVLHPGMSHSVSDVYQGVCDGLEWAGAEVERIEWHDMLRPLNAMTRAAIEGGKLDDEKAQRLLMFATRLASGDVLDMIVMADVDAVIVVNGLLFPPSRAGVLRKLGLPVACIGTEAPYFLKDEQQIAPYYDLWFTNEKNCVAEYDTRTVYLPHAYNPRVHQPGEPDEKKHSDVVFIGGGFPERKRLLEGVDWTGIHREVLGTLWGVDIAQERGATDFARNQRWTEGVVPNEEAAQWYRSSKISLNMHRTMGHIEKGDVIQRPCYSLGPRAYEIPACGGFMLIDDERPEVKEVFKDCAATYKSWDSASLEREIKWWLHHESYRLEWQAAQHERILPHHWGNRAKVILEHLLP